MRILGMLEAEIVFAVTLPALLNTPAPELSAAEAVAAAARPAGSRRIVLSANPWTLLIVRPEHATGVRKKSVRNRIRCALTPTQEEEYCEASAAPVHRAD
jgi:hypothetical protein